MPIKFLMPTEFYLGKDAVANHAAVFASMGKKALLVTGKSSAKLSGAQDDIIQILAKNDIAYSIFDEIEANPSIESTLKGAAFAAFEKVDFVIGIGGGSPLDAAKTIALFAGANLSIEDVLQKRFPKHSLPTILIPTTAGTGSEVTPYSILTDLKSKSKFNVSSPITFAKYAIADAKYTESLPKTIAINTTIDALSHSIEGMLGLRHNDLTDLLAKESISLICQRFPALHQEKLSYKDREALLYASSLGGMVISQTGTTAVHAMGYALTNYKGIDHGRANALLIGGFLRFIQSKDSQRIAEIMKAAGFKNLDEFCQSLDALLGDIEKISPQECIAFTKLTMANKNVRNSDMQPEEADILKIFKDRFDA